MKNIKLYSKKILNIWKLIYQNKLNNSYNDQTNFYYFSIIGLTLGVINFSIFHICKLIIPGTEFKINLFASLLIIAIQHFIEKGFQINFLKNSNFFFFIQKFTKKKTNQKTIIIISFIILQILGIYTAIHTKNLWLLILIPSLSYLSLASIHLLSPEGKLPLNMIISWLILVLIFSVFEISSLFIFIIIWFIYKLIYTKFNNNLSTSERKNITAILTTSCIYTLIFLIYG